METARISDDDRIGRNTVPLPQNDTSGLQTAGRNTVVNDRHARAAIFGEEERNTRLASSETKTIRSVLRYR